MLSTSTALPQVIINRRTTTLVPQRDSQGYFYEPQTTTSTTTEAPQRDSPGYFYDPPNNGYIPPDTSFADEPLPPSFADEYPSVDNQYLPPNEDNPLQDDPILGDPPANDYLPPPQQQQPQRDEILLVTPDSGYQYNPPTSATPPLADEGFLNPNDDNGYNYDPPVNGYLPPVGRALRDEVPNSARFPIRLQLNELTCLQNDGGFFRSTLTVQSAIDSAPLVDVDSADDISGCDVRVQQTRLLVNVGFSDFTRCGVQQCGSNARELCLRLRFPRISGMRTASDAILTLQCKIQQRIVAKTHAVRLGVSDDVQGRSASGTFAYGGSQRPFRSQLGLFRRKADGGAFTRSLEPGGAVMLGEEVILRTQVRSGDGWNFTRLSDVIMQRLSPTGSVLNSAILIATNGCLNPAMKTICPGNPVLESPLSYRLSFRAAMFQGMHSGDEMVMRVRIVGCVDRRECTVENCASIRSKRNTASNATIEETTVDPQEHELPSEVASISFRIMIPSNSTVSIQPAPQSSSILTLSAVAISLIMVIALIILGSIIKLYRTRKLTYDEYRSD
ncbi:uncharacterized protein LOC129769839 isoform X2 [Toxorhynchites rutilus septentrionalis]|nr:uncharacterized protein LOC129769839 isoform X2 [Toxorhynchites rutilus septentrionalis]